MEHNTGTLTHATALDTINELTGAINRGDLTGMLEHFDSEAVLVVQALGDKSAQVARGHAAIREAYAGFFSMKPSLQRLSQHIIESGDTALHFSKWALTATGPDGKKMERTAISSDVLRKQPGGRWLVVIYNPYGTSVLG